MDHWLSALSQLQEQSSAALLERCNHRSRGYGLTLSQGSLTNLLQHRAQTLQQTGRVELGGGILEKLVSAFCDSPFLAQRHYEEILTELQEWFYHFKNECRDLVSDDELIGAMALIYNGVANGSTEFFEDVDWETMYRVAISGSLRGTDLEPPEYMGL